MKYTLTDKAGETSAEVRGVYDSAGGVAIWSE